MKKQRKKLIEVSLPLEAINRESQRRKQKAPKGYPTAIHKYWAQRPVALCRAVIFAQLVDDPSSVPEEFPTIQAQVEERARLHRLIERLILWENSKNEHVLTEARYEIARALARARNEKLPALEVMTRDEVVARLRDLAPPFHDPFSGGASIPLEAQRLGLEVKGSDLNPVAVLIGKALCEIPAKFCELAAINPTSDRLRHYQGAEGIAEDVRFYGQRLRELASAQLTQYYPPTPMPDHSLAPVTAWIWVRTVISPDPRAGGASVPLASTFILSSKSGSEVIVTLKLDRIEKTWEFVVQNQPSADDIKKAKSGTKSARGGSFTCVLTGAAIPEVYVKAEAMAGRMGVRLMALVAEHNRSRIYLSPTPDQESAAMNVAEVDVPEIDQLMSENPRWFSPPSYGMPRFKDLFTKRQLKSLSTVSDLIRQVQSEVLARASTEFRERTGDSRSLALGGEGPTAYADAIAIYLAMALDRMVFYGSTLCGWLSKDNAMGKSMPQQALAMSWDFAEGNPLGKSSSDISTCIRAVADCVENTYPYFPATIELRDASLNAFAHGTIFSTDPPYYDNVGYADLSDFFYGWIRKSLGGIVPELCRHIATPKTAELVAIPFRHGGVSGAEKFFMEGMRKALMGIADSTADLPATIYYAYKQQEVGKNGLTSPGWSSFLQAVVDSGFAIDGTWPVRSESAGRSVAQGTNALASSIVLVCRRRETKAPTATRADFVRALRREMPDALHAIRAAGIGPTDIQQSAIGPGIGIFTRYSEVLNSDGSPLLVKDALELINQVREEVAADFDADYDQETRFALDWFSAFGFEVGKSGDAILMTNAVNVSLDGVKRAGFFHADAGVARLFRREELPEDWDPKKDDLPTVWEACQHLIKRLIAEDGGLDAAARLYAKLGHLAEPAQTLARRLYDICEQKRWPNEGYAYNNLFQEWDAIRERAEALSDADLFTSPN